MRSGAEVVQLYVGFAQSEVVRPVKLLRGFEKVDLEPGEARQVELRVPVSELAWYDEAQRTWRVEAMSYEVFVGGSADHSHSLEGAFEVIP